MTERDSQGRFVSKFEVEDNATPKLVSLSGSLQSLGKQFAGTEGHMGAFGGALGLMGQGLMGILGAVPSVASGIMSLGATISKLGSRYEEVQGQLAGNMAALGMVKAADGADAFTVGLDSANAVMKDIEIAAAKLPGMADAYYTIINAGLPSLNNAFKDGTDMSVVTKFATDYAGITQGLGVNANQAGRDLNAMLASGQGRTREATASFARLNVYMKQIPGYANQTAASFNKMNEEARKDLLAQGMAKMDAYLKHAGGTMGAMTGTMVSNFERIGRLAGAPVFDAMKKGLNAFNELLINGTTGALTPLGQTIVNIGANISDLMVAGIKSAITQVEKLGKAFLGLRSSPAFQAVWKAVSGTVEGVIGAGTTAAANATGPGGEPASPAVAAITGVVAVLGQFSPIIALVGSALIGFFSNTEAVSSIFTDMVSIYSQLVTWIEPLITFIMLVGTSLGEFAALVLPPLIGAVKSVVEALTPLWKQFLSVATAIYEKIQPALHSFFEAIGGVIKAIGDFLKPAISFVGGILMGLWEKIAWFVVPIFTTVVEAITWFVNVIKKVINYLTSLIPKSGKEMTALLGSGLERVLADVGDAVGGPKSADVPKLDAFVGAVAKLADRPVGADPKSTAKTHKTAPEERGGGGKTVQDFRFSRFDIQQKFAEGFDPDRVATAFASDLGKIGDMRLQSGFDPLFSLR